MKRNNPYLSRRDFIIKTSVLGVGAGISSIIPSYANPFSSTEASRINRLETNPMRYKGYQIDLATRSYILGGGNRSYNPGIMRFHALDTMSPFGKGGINSYAYCLGDPVNRKDPSGHILISFLIAAIIGAIIGAISAAIVEGIRAAATGTPFQWKAVAIGAAVGFLSGGFGALGAGATIGVKVGLAVLSATLQAGAVFAIELLAGASLEEAAIQAGITFGIAIITFGIGVGVKSALKHTVAGRTLSAKASAAGQSIKASIRNKLKSFNQLANAKLGKFKDELLQFRQTPAHKAYVNRIGSVEDLIDELAQPGVHKFVIDRSGNLNIGTINGVHPKSLSHPVIGMNLADDVVSAGYMATKAGKIFIANHSGHFHPDYRSLWAAKDVLMKLGVENPVFVKAGMNPKFVILKASGAW